MTTRSRTLLPRLVVDGILPCTLAALTLIATFTVQQLRDLDRSTQLRFALQAEQLSNNLLQANSDQAQHLLDLALQHGSALQRIELREPDGSQLASGAPGAITHPHYQRELRSADGGIRQLSVQADPREYMGQRHTIWRRTAFHVLGVLLLAMLSTRATRHCILAPLQRLQQSLSRAGEESAPAPRMPEPHREFEQLQVATEKLAALLHEYRVERATIQRATAGDALDQLRRSQAAARSKSQFMALVGHHFRQPLQAMQLLTASLHPGIDAEQQALLLEMRGSISTMTRLLDALLEISRLDAGVVAVQSIRFSVNRLFRQDRNELLDEARRHRITLSWHGSHDQLFGDPGLTAALLRQLIRNAIAFTPPGGRVLVAARWQPHGVRIEVRDSGNGIAAIQQQRIFEEFVQLQGESDRSDGYGLGLSIASRLARALGTRIELRSEPGRGSTFRFDLKRLPSQRPSTGIGATNVASAAR